VAQTIQIRTARHRKARKQAPAAATGRQADASRVRALMKGGRAWINGTEVGGTDPRFAHLDRSYD
jgi:hypothetical protein